MEVKYYRHLPEDAVSIRDHVFIQEQGFAEEFDEIDNIAVHIVLYQDTVPIATCRVFWDVQKGAYVIGRIAVAKEYRGKSVGACLLKEAERQIAEAGGKAVLLAAQKQAVGFYVKQGYSTTGAEFYEEHCAHIWMHKVLSKQSSACAKSN